MWLSGAKIRNYRWIQWNILFLWMAHWGTVVPDIRFEHISIQQGLSQSTITCIIQDHQGFLWFGTKDGLNKYDGYKFTIFRSEPNNPLTLSHNFIWTIFQDRDGFLWIGTMSGLNRYNPQTNRFTRFMQPASPGPGLSYNEVRAIGQDSSGSIWIGTWGGGLNCYHPQNSQFVQYQYTAEQPSGLSDNHIWAIHTDRKGQVWVGTLGGLERFEPETGTFIHFKHDPHDRFSLSSDAVKYIYEDANGELWIGTWNGGLNQMDRARGTFKRFCQQANNPASLSNDFVHCISQDQRGVFWIGTLGGVNKFDPTSRKFTRICHDHSDIFSLSHNWVRAICEDRSGVLWFGTAQGISKLVPPKDQFQHIRSAVNNPRSLNGNSVYAIYEDRARNRWIGTYEGGLNYRGANLNFFQHIRHSPQNPNSLSSNDIRCILEDHRGNIWVGTENGLNRRIPTPKSATSPENHRFIRYYHRSGQPGTLSHDFILTLFEDRLRNLWIGTANGLNCYVPAQNRFINYHPHPNDSLGLSHPYVYCLYQDHTGTLWIGTAHGLNQMHADQTTFTRYFHESGNPNSLSHNIILSMHEDHHSGLWIGTGGGGLNRYDRESNTWQNFRDKNGLINNVIYGILEDSHGCLWLSTNNGLAQFYPETGTFKSYNVLNGLLNNEYNTGAFFKSPQTDTLFFGGIEGCDMFLPASLTENTYIPPVVITSFLKFNQETALDSVISAKKNLVLSHRDYAFTFEFVALDYQSPEKNQYAYQMVGLDPDWIFVDAKKRYAAYTTLAPGEYVFKVKGSNNNGIWNESGAVLKIRITPPFWKTPWFRLSLIFSLCSSIWLAYRLRTFAIRKRNIELEQSNQMLNDQINQRIKAEMRIKQRINLEKALARVSKLFIGPAVDLTAALKLLGQTLKVNRAFVFQLNENSTILSSVHQWHQGNKQDSFQPDPILKVDDFPWWFNSFAHHDCLTVVNLKRLSPPAKSELRCLVSPAAQSLFVAPISTTREQLLGFIGFEDWEKKRKWSGEDIRLLRMAAEMICLHWERKQTLEKSRLLQEKLIQSNKLESLGTLASGVAHEINNPNNSIRLNIALLSDIFNSLLPVINRYYQKNREFMIRGMNYSAIRERIPKLFTGIESASRKIEIIVSDLKNFARHEPPDLTSLIDVNQVVQSALTLAHNFIAKSTTNFSVQFHDPLPKVQGNFQKIEQVIINLLQNACQALTDTNKKISIQTSADIAMKHVLVVVADEGIGISSENLERIRDPFFTTKRNIGGTGLGLSIASTILTEHGGTMEFESTPGVGTIVTIRLPASMRQT